jgi:hypothetical protein
VLGRMMSIDIAYSITASAFMLAKRDCHVSDIPSHLGMGIRARPRVRRRAQKDSMVAKMAVRRRARVGPAKAQRLPIPVSLHGRKPTRRGQAPVKRQRHHEFDRKVTLGVGAGQAAHHVWCKRSNVPSCQHLRRRRGSLVQP